MFGRKWQPSQQTPLVHTHPPGGAVVGLAVGRTVGVAVGATVGRAVGAGVGAAVGSGVVGVGVVGAAVGATVGAAVGAAVGARVVGVGVAATVGRLVGVGATVVGAGVGGGVVGGGVVGAAVGAGVAIGGPYRTSAPFTSSASGPKKDYEITLVFLRATRCIDPPPNTTGSSTQRRRWGPDAPIPAHARSRVPTLGPTRFGRNDRHT